MKFPNVSGKNPTLKPTRTHTFRRALAIGLVLAVLAAAVAYAAGGGIITLNGATSGTVTVQVPAVAGSTTFQLPGNNGTNTYVLQTDGTGVTSWVAAGAGSSSLSGLTAATAGHSFNNFNYAQTWTWGTLGANTALTLSSTGMTTGMLLNLSNTDAAANAGTVLIVSNSEGGNSYGISSTMLSATNTGAAGYFSNSTTNAGYAVYGTMTAHANTGYAGYFVNTDTSGASNFGVYSYIFSTSTIGNGGTAVYAEGDCVNCASVYGTSVNGTGIQGNSSNGSAIYGYTLATGYNYFAYGQAISPTPTPAPISITASMARPAARHPATAWALPAAVPTSV
jgi:hypothetical protein